MLWSFVFFTSLTSLVHSQSSGATFTINNYCYQNVDLYVNGVKDVTVPNLGNITKVVDKEQTTISTDFNSRGPEGDGSVQLGFYQDYYYMVIDPYYINTGVKIEPSTLPDPNSNFCAPIDCEALQCRSAFSEAPKTFPETSESPPEAPYYRCPDANKTYEISFCPQGTIPDEYQAIHFNSQNKCLDLRNFIISDGTPVQIKDCNRLVAQQWSLTKSPSKLIQFYARLCVDAGIEPKSGDLLLAWTCSDDRPYQTWSYEDNRYKLSGTELCMDLINGDTTPENRVQLLQCDANSESQIWTL